MPAPDYPRQFIKAFEKLGPHRHRHDLFSDFMEMAACAIRKTTIPPGEAADALEARYMAGVARNKVEDVRAMPELLGITHLALAEGGCDFLGSVVSQLELLNSHMGQFFTPYEVSRMMAGIILQDAGEIIDRKGFVTLSEPTCGAGGMILAAADILASQGRDIGQTVYVDATDLSQLCFHMCYIQLSLRGIPAVVRRGNSLSLEMFETARTPALMPFLIQHGDPFKDQKGGRQEGLSVRLQESTPSGASSDHSRLGGSNTAHPEAPYKPAGAMNGADAPTLPAESKKRTGAAKLKQLDLFGD